MENFKKKIIIILEKLVEKLKKCIDNKQVINFQKLTPIDDADLTGYKEALDYAFKEDEIKNIAITGSYGSGKSSILNTYKKNSTLKFIHISFLHFKECDKDDTNICENKEESNDDKEKDKISNEKIREEILERKIINHIINQIPFKYIPYTNFNVRGKKGFKNSIIQVSFIVSIFYVILFFTQYKLNEIFILEFWKESKIQIILLIISIVIILCNLIFSNNFGRGILSKIKFENIELDTSALGKYDSFFDKYLNEIIYIFENCKAKVIVFEDIDRLEMRIIFERLREINVLLNERLTKKNKVIKFCYLIRDDIFNSEDRVKFFDFIIPIIPIMNSFNAYHTFKNYFKKYIDELNSELVYEICKHVIDMRILKNIYNEFLIYIKKYMDDKRFNFNKILVMIVYKNLFVKDFNNLNHNKGFLFNIFRYSNIRKQISDEYTNALNDSLNKLENMVKKNQRFFIEHYCIDMNANEIKKYMLFLIYMNIENINVLNFKEENIFKLRYLESKYFDNSERHFQEWFVSTIEDDCKNKINETFKDIIYEILENELNIENITYIRHKNISNKLFNDILDKYASITNDISLKSRYDLLFYLIKNGFIDDIFINYLTCNFKNSTDNKFLLNLFIKKEKLEFDYKLIDAEYIILCCDYIVYRDNSYILNFDLLDKLLYLNKYTTNKEYKIKLKSFMSQLKYEDNVYFVVRYFNRNNKELNELFIDTLNFNVKFENISELKLSPQLFKYVIYKGLYEINSKNLYLVMKEMIPNFKEEDFYHKNFSLINRYLLNLFNRLRNIKIELYTYIITYVHMSKGIINDDEDSAICLINLLFQIQFSSYYQYCLKKYLSVLKTKITLAYKIDPYIKNYNEYSWLKELYKELFNQKTIKYFVENIYDYYVRIEQIDDELIIFINLSNEKLKFYNKCSDYDIKDVKSF